MAAFDGEKDMTLDLSVVMSFDYQLTEDLTVGAEGVQEGPPPFDPTSPLETRVLPGYAVTEKIGQGSYGAVWGATQATTRQRVAIKVLRSGPRQGLQREVASVLEVSEHPHVVPLIDARLENDPAFLVTPLMQGSLGGYIRQTQNPQEVESALVRLWMKQVASALAHVHRKGIVHCDLKPDNILLDDQGNCKVCDFGQATLLGEGGSSLGTYFFMSPEQTRLAESAGQVKAEPAWDLYSLGATFYYLSTGQQARGGLEFRQSLSQEENARQRLHLYREGILATPLVPTRQLNAGLEPSLCEVIDRCLDLDPKRRYSSADEVVSILSMAGGTRHRGSTSIYVRSFWDRVRLTPVGKLAAGQSVNSREFNQLLLWTCLLMLPMAALAMGVLGRS